MLEELRYAQAHWSEETSIGRLVLRYTPDMVKAYPPFVNFFENTKEMLQQCDRENPRFVQHSQAFDFYYWIFKFETKSMFYLFITDFMHSWKSVKQSQSVADKVYRSY